MPGTYRKRIYMSSVHSDSFRQTPICAHSTRRVKIRKIRNSGVIWYVSDISYDITGAFHPDIKILVSRDIDV